MYMLYQLSRIILYYERFIEYHKDSKNLWDILYSLMKHQMLGSNTYYRIAIYKNILILSDWKHNKFTYATSLCWKVHLSFRVQKKIVTTLLSANGIQKSWKVKTKQ